MLRHTALKVLSAALVVAAGCSDSAARDGITGVEPANADRLSVIIVGPRLVSTPGFYEWTAEVSGSGADVTYEWTIDGIARPLDGAMDGAVLRLALDDYLGGALEITVVVRSGDEAALATETIAMCPDVPAADWCLPSELLVRR